MNSPVKLKGLREKLAWVERFLIVGGGKEPTPRLSLPPQALEYLIYTLLVAGIGLERSLQERTGTTFLHGICPECAKQWAEESGLSGSPQ